MKISFLFIKLIMLCIAASMQMPGNAQHADHSSNAMITYGSSSKDKVRVMILGVFHFASQNDRINVKLDDILGERRQKEIAELNDGLLKYKPGKIFIEWQPRYQSWVDSLYHEYTNGNFTLKANEVYQIGFRLAKALNLPTVYCMDAPGNYLYDTLVMTANSHGQGVWFQHYVDSITAHVIAQDSLDKDLSIRERLLKGNLSEHILQSHTLNAGVEVAPYLGAPGEYGGVEFMGEWYKRNMRMYSNIVRLMEPSDRTVLIIVGAGHARILQHLFEDNAAYELVDPVVYLK